MTLTAIQPLPTSPDPAKTPEKRSWADGQFGQALTSAVARNRRNSQPLSSPSDLARPAQEMRDRASDPAPSRKSRAEKAVPAPSDSIDAGSDELLTSAQDAPQQVEADSESSYDPTSAATAQATPSADENPVHDASHPGGATSDPTLALVGSAPVNTTTKLTTPDNATSTEQGVEPAADDAASAAPSSTQTSKPSPGALSSLPTMDAQATSGPSPQAAAPVSSEPAPAAPLAVASANASSETPTVSAPPPASPAATVGHSPAAELPPTPTHAQETDPNIARIGRGIQTALQQNGGTVTLRLTPPELGVVRIQMELQQGVVSANLITESQSVSTLLNHQLSQLHHALESRGLVVEQLQVQTQTPAAPPQQSQQQAGQSPDDGRSRGQYASDDRSSGQHRHPEEPRQPRTFAQELVNLVG